jgi:hypothetical protein
MLFDLFKNYDKFPRTAGIYKIITLHNGEFYIGSALSLKKRMKDHRNELKNDDSHVDYMQNVFNVHGESDFKVEFLYVGDCVLKLNTEEHQDLLQREEDFIQQLSPRYNTIKTPTSQFNNPATSIKVYQYTREGEFVKEWNSGREVQRELGIQIRNALIADKTSRSSGGFQWSYKKVKRMPRYKSNSGSNYPSKRKIIAS